MICPKCTTKEWGRFPMSCPQCNDCVMKVASEEEMQEVEKKNLDRLREANGEKSSGSVQREQWPSWQEELANADWSPQGDPSAGASGSTGATGLEAHNSPGADSSAPQRAQEDTTESPLVGRIVVAGAQSSMVYNIQPGTSGIVCLACGEYVWVSWNCGPGLAPRLAWAQLDSVLIAADTLENKVMTRRETETGWIVFCATHDGRLYPAYSHAKGGVPVWNRPAEVSREFAEAEYGRAIMRWIRSHPKEAPEVISRGPSMVFD